MELSDEEKRKLSRMRSRLRRVWLMGGLGPLAVVLLLMIGISGVAAEQEAGSVEVSLITIERKFTAVLAVSALLFFVGFSLDGRWTDVERLGDRTYKAAGGNGFTPTRSQLSARAHLAFSSIDSSVTALTIIGVVMGLVALLAVLSGLAITYGLQLLVLAAVYQLFIFSRHPYYDEVLEAAIHGELPSSKDKENSQE